VNPDLEEGLCDNKNIAHRRLLCVDQQNVL